MKKGRKILCSLLILVLLAAVGCGVYICDYHRADDAAMAAMASDETVTVESDNGMTVFSPALPEAGLIFYPGGKVEYTAYAPLMKALAQEGLLCVLVEMPGNLAVLDVNAAEDIPDRYPGIGTWYIGGHSLGGSMAASYVSEHRQDYDGLILLAAYSTADLKDSGLSVLLVRGDRDGVLNLTKYEDSLSNLPHGTCEWIIYGGNHAQFGSYGHQEGDGDAAISAGEQIAQTVQAVLGLMEA